MKQQGEEGITRNCIKLSLVFESYCENLMNISCEATRTFASLSRV